MRRPGRSASSARSTRRRPSRCATSARATCRRWTNFNYNEINIVENEFLNEFKAGTSQPAGQHRGGPRQFLRLLRRGHGHLAAADLPGVLHRIRLAGGRSRRDIRASQFTNSTFVNPLAVNNPNAAGRSRRPATATPARRANALRAGLPANFFVVNPDMLGGAHDHW